MGRGQGTQLCLQRIKRSRAFQQAQAEFNHLTPRRTAKPETHANGTSPCLLWPPHTPPSVAPCWNQGKGRLVPVLSSRHITRTHHTRHITRIHVISHTCRITHTHTFYLVFSHARAEWCLTASFKWPTLHTERRAYTPSAYNNTLTTPDKLVQNWLHSDLPVQVLCIFGLSDLGCFTKTSSPKNTSDIHSILSLVL